MMGRYIVPLRLGFEPREDAERHQGAFHLIMPKAELDGLGFLSQLAARPAADIPIIVISGLGEPLGEGISRQVSSLLRLAAVLPKPIPLDTLAQALDRLLGPGSLS